jgi:mono/diheme cytochrome c family protein
MDTLGFPYSDEEILQLENKNELDALVAYVQVIGTAVARKRVPPAAERAEPVEIENPLAGDPAAILAGKGIYEEFCSDCHGENAEGDIGPSLVDDVFLYVEGDLADDDYYELINNGTEEGNVEEGRAMKGGMPPFREDLSRDEMWSVISYIRSLKKR